MRWVSQPHRRRTNSLREQPTRPQRLTPARECCFFAREPLSCSETGVSIYRVSRWRVGTNTGNPRLPSPLAPFSLARPAATRSFVFDELVSKEEALSLGLELARQIIASSFDCHAMLKCSEYSVTRSESDTPKATRPMRPPLVSKLRFFRRCRRQSQFRRRKKCQMRAFQKGVVL
jgi:hypothetical protein